MTNQLNITHQNSTLNWTKLWFFSKIFLSVLIAVTIFSSITEIPSAFYLCNIVLCLLFLITMIVVKFKKKQISFININHNQLEYFCPVKKELVTIRANEITKVTTQFCELQIHTINRTHCLNMEKIKQESQRWEIKEMIKNLVVENEKRACGF